MLSEMFRPLLGTLLLYAFGCIQHRLSGPQVRIPAVLAFLCGTTSKHVNKGGLVMQWLALWYLIGVLFMFFRHRYDLLIASGLVGFFFAVFLGTVYLIISLVVSLFK